MSRLILPEATIGTSKDQLNAVSTIDRKRSRCFELNANSRRVATRLDSSRFSVWSRVALRRDVDRKGAGKISNIPCRLTALNDRCRRNASKEEMRHGTHQPSTPYTNYLRREFAVFPRLKPSVVAFQTRAQQFSPSHRDFFPSDTRLIALILTIAAARYFFSTKQRSLPRCFLLRTTVSTIRL